MNKNVLNVLNAKKMIEGVFFNLFVLSGDGLGFFIENKERRIVSRIFNKNSDFCDRQLFKEEVYTGSDFREAKMTFEAMESMVNSLCGRIAEAKYLVREKKEQKKKLIKSYGSLEKAKTDNRFEFFERDVKFFRKEISELNFFCSQITNGNDVTVKDLIKVVVKEINSHNFADRGNQPAFLAGKALFESLVLGLDS